mgnify:CR=1 FL=1
MVVWLGAAVSLREPRGAGLFVPWLWVDEGVCFNRARFADLSHRGSPLRRCWLVGGSGSDSVANQKDGKITLAIYRSLRIPSALK